MYTENHELAARIGDLAAECCQELFSAYGVELARSSEQTPDTEDRLYCGIVGFVGSSVRGTCLLLGNEGPLRASQPAHGSLADWVGELTNQLVGRLKSKCLARSLEIALTTPIVVSGVRVQPLPKSPLRPTAFEAHGGHLSVWLETESDLQITFDTIRPDAGAQEGNLVLF